MMRWEIYGQYSLSDKGVDMKFNKDNFIKKNGELAYRLLIDFLDCEMNEKTCQTLKFLLSLENIRRFSYEGNQYVVDKDPKESLIIIYDEVSEENGAAEELCTLKIPANELLNIIFEFQEILKTYL